MVFYAFDVTKPILNAFESVGLFKILTEIIRNTVIFSIFYFLFSYSVQRPKGWRIKLSKNLLSPIFVAKEVPGIYIYMYTPSQNMTRVSIHAALLYTAYILVHVHTLYQINLTQSCSTQSCLFLFENLVKYRRVTRQPITSACCSFFPFSKRIFAFFSKKNVLQD